MVHIDTLLSALEVQRAVAYDVETRRRLMGHKIDRGFVDPNPIMYLYYVVSLLVRASGPAGARVAKLETSENPVASGATNLKAQHSCLKLSTPQPRLSSTFAEHICIKK